MMIHAILDGKEVKPIDDFLAWAKWFESANRIVAKYCFGDIVISTVFLGVDHGFMSEPLWFETMIFGGEHDGYCERYTTWAQAEEGHLRAMNLAGMIH